MAFLMKQTKRKEHLKKLMFIQHIIFWAIICLGIGFIITKTLANDWSVSRNQWEYINDYFWSQNPATGNVFDALYSGETAYTRNMSWYDFQNNSCNKSNINIVIYTWWNQYTILPEIITGNTIFILNSWTYVNTISQITLSGDCIAIIGSWKATFWGNIIRNAQTKYSIIDNISYRNNSFYSPAYSIQTGINIQIFANSTSNYLISGSFLSGYITGTIQSQSTNIPITLQYPNSSNTIDISLYDTYNHINHIKKTIINDNITPILTAFFSWTVTAINNWGTYNTGINLNINDDNLSWVTNNWTLLSDSSFLFINQWVYNIIALDKAWNSTGISFEIDTTPPNITNLQPFSGNIINTSLLTLSWTTQENTTKIKFQTYYLYSGTTLLSSGLVQAGITSQTLPNINNGTYRRQIILEDTAGNIATWEASNIRFTKTPSIFISPTAHLLSNKRYTNTDPIILLSGNKNFDYTIIKSGFILGNSSYIWITKQEIIPMLSQTGDIIVQIGYTTQDWEIWTGNFSFFIDTITPQFTLKPLWKRTNSTSSILYTRTGSKADNMIKYYNFLINDTVVYSGTNKYYTKTWLQVNWIYIAQVRWIDIAGNIWQSIAETTIIDQTAPTIHNVTNNTLYKELPYPIIRDENNDPVQVTVKKSWITILSGVQNTPYVVWLNAGEFVYSITTTDIAGNTTWLTFTIDTTAPTVGLLTPITWTNITGSNSVIFTWTWSDTNFSWFDFSLRSNDYWYFSTGRQTTNKNLTINNLNNGTYYRKVIATDKAGNTTSSSTQYFSISVPLTWQISIDWATTIAYIQYVNSENIKLVTNVNKPTIGTITWNIVGEYWSQIINKEIWAGSQTTSIQLTAGEWRKDIYITLQDYIDNNILSSFQSVVVDKTAPSKPILTTINNQIYTGIVTLTWPVATDNWAGIKGYNYQITQNNQTKKAGTTSSASMVIQNMELGNQGSFIIKIKAIDNVNNESDRSENAVFSYNGIPDTSPDSFTFSRQTNVEIEETYKSNTITITWLSLNTTVMASIDEWTLFVNWINVDERALVQNWDVLYIELESSDEYDDVTTSTLTINDKTATFKLTTEDEDNNDDENDNEDDDYDLSDDEIDELEETYELISILDSNLKLKFKEMLEDKIDELEEEDEDNDEIEKLRYIYDRVVEDINWTEDTIYTAPNGKTYVIIYKEWVWYSSINFSTANKTKYFSTLTEIKAFIDKNNTKTSLNYTIDTSRSTAAYTAPNAKVYKLFRTTNGQYGSYNMVIPKLFSTLQELKNHIYKNNPKK